MVKKETLLYYAKDEDDKILLSKIYDSYLRCCEKNYNTYSDFISEERKECLSEIFKKDGNSVFLTYGGYEGAERVVSAFLANEDRVDFPVRMLKITGKGVENLSHRDILGALMGLGIKRETVGDIITGETVYIAVKKEIADYIILNFNKAGRISLSCDYSENDEVKREEKTEIITTTVSSLRLDIILTAGFKVKRNDAVRYINQGRVSVSGKNNLSSDSRVKENDRITLRGYGKIIYLGESGTSKKGKIIINIKRFL